MTINNMSCNVCNVCNKTPDPVLCKTCLDSDLKSATTDIWGLATISISCGTRDADNLYNDTDDIYESTKDVALHNLLDECWWRFMIAPDNIDAAAQILHEKRSDGAKQLITEYAIPIITFCSDLFKKNPAVVIFRFKG
ncbi:hypothetical protein V6N12_023459 [Hibiscus sabdariffa]|uniref:Pectinesterase inhibitor domain-containing protein n=1 Tax=Hibiscus sabdariffa TaxID=183260 RepID=A0ABR2FXW7_9ROSI